MNQAATIADQFLKEHRVEIHSESVLPGWHSHWVVDGRQMSTKAVKRLLIPAVRESIGINPAALKAVIWKLITKTMNHGK